jgi:hypothetical protein
MIQGSIQVSDLDPGEHAREFEALLSSAQASLSG